MAATQSDLKRLRVFLQMAKLNPEERRQFEGLLKEAENGDRAALTRVKHVASVRGYQSIPGKDVPLPPGLAMICPEDPAHYRTFQREVGETLYCPVHKVALVPNESDD